MCPYVSVTSALVAGSSQSIRIVRPTVLRVRVCTRRIRNALLLAGAFEETKPRELLKRGGDRCRRGVGIDLECLDELLGDVSRCRPAGAPSPAEAGALLGLMHLVCL